MKKGDKIKILQMEDYSGHDVQATRMNGNIYTVEYIDDAGQIHLLESGLAIIPGLDKYVVIEREKDSIQEYQREVLGIFDVVSDYIKFNDYIDEDDGLYLTEDNEILLIPNRGIPKGGEGLFFPMKTLVRNTLEGLIPDVDAIEDIVNRYVFVK